MLSYELSWKSKGADMKDKQKVPETRAPHTGDAAKTNAIRSGPV